MIVVADTSPINYLVRIDQIDVLHPPSRILKMTFRRFAGFARPIPPLHDCRRDTSPLKYRIVIQQIITAECWRAEV